MKKYKTEYLIIESEKKETVQNELNQLPEGFCVFGGLNCTPTDKGFHFSVLVSRTYEVE